MLDATAEREKYIAEMERFQKEVDDNFEERKKVRDYTEESVALSLVSLLTITQLPRNCTGV